MPTSASPKYRSLKGFHFFLATSVVALIWGGYLLEQVYKIDFRGREVRRGNEMPIWVPLAVTPGAFLIAWYYARRARAFLNRAVVVQAVVDSLGDILLQGYRNITYSYWYDYRPYESKQSTFNIDIEKHKLVPGSHIEILVDPKNPGYSRLAFEFQLIEPAEE